MKYEDYKAEALKDPKLRQEYDALQPEYDIARALVYARKEQSITQAELSQKTGVTQADISRIENGNANPSIATLAKIAKGLNKQLRVSFV